MGFRWMKSIFIYLIIIAAILAIFSTFFPLGKSVKTVALWELVDQAKQGSIDTVRQEGDALVGLKDKKAIVKSSFLGSTTDLMQLLKEQGVVVGGREGIKLDVKEQKGFNWWGTLITILPLLFFGALIFFMLRNAQGMNSQAMNFGRSRARVLSGDRPKVTFADVAGVEEAKTELLEVVEFLKYAEKFQSLGARIPRGVLLVGPPGTGKTSD